MINPSPYQICLERAKKIPGSTAAEDDWTTGLAYHAKGPFCLAQK
jgi:hypothetical protein